LVAPLPDKQRIAWLRLSRTDNIGPITFFKLLRKYRDVEHVLHEIPYLAKKGGRPLHVASQAQAEDEIAATQKLGGHIVCFDDPCYPANLKTIPDAPPVLSILGSPQKLQKQILAIVGGRNASILGKNLSRSFAHDLVTKGYTVASGLARGIDTCAHIGALSAPKENFLNTVAVLAGGVDQVYPEENKDLYHQIKDKGLILSEAPMGMAPLAHHFPRRNRLISGLSQGTIIIEAAAKSGSLTTARMTLDQNRDLFVVPGSPIDPRYHGSHQLIKDGAYLMQTLDDILPSLRCQSLPLDLKDEDSYFPHNAIMNQDSAQDIHQIILDNLSWSPIAIDEIPRVISCTPSMVMQALLELELAGKVLMSSGNYVQLTQRKEKL